MESKKNHRDWKELPSELLRVISNKLSDLIYFVRFRAVCKAWRCSTSLSDAPPQFPWLLQVTSRYNSWVALRKEFRFHALSSGITGTIRVMGFRHQNYFARPSCASLLLLDTVTNVVSVINPLRNSKRKLSTIRGARQPWPVWTGKDPMCMRSRNMIVLNMGHLRNSDNWTVSFNGKRLLVIGGCRSVCTLGGMLFIAQGSCTTFVFNVATMQLLHEIDFFLEDEEKAPCLDIYLVESAGVVLRVSRFGNDEEPTFRIYQLDIDQRKINPSWVQVTSIGDQMLFLDVSNGFSMDATSFPGYKGNCIHFLSSGHKPCRYDIANGTVEWLLCPLNRCTWYLPRL